MKKKNVLALAVMLSILQESSCFATSHNPADSYLNHGVYTEFVKSTKQSIVLNNKDAVYTFNKGASIAIDEHDYNDSYYIYNPISNSTNHSLTINVGGALTEGSKRYEFYLKPQINNSLDELSAGISISGPGSNNTINMQNADMKIDLSNGARYGIKVSADYGEGKKTYLNINATNSDIDIYDSDAKSNSAIMVDTGGSLNIIGNGKSDINISGSFSDGIKTDGAGKNNVSTSLNIKDINDINILLNRDENSYAINTKNEKVNIDINGSLNIASLNDKNIHCGINISEADRNDVDFDLKAKGDINISGVLCGISAQSSHYMSGDNVGSNNIDIVANSIKINANSHKDVTYSGTGIMVMDGNEQGRDIKFNITATGNDGININAEGFGYYAQGTIASNIIAEKGSINVNGGLQGLRFFTNTTDEDKKSLTSIKAKNDININSKYEGIEYVVNAGSLELKSEEGGIQIISGRDALRHTYITDMEIIGSPGNSSCAGIAANKIETTISADKNVLISGKNSGVKYVGINTGSADIVSQSENVYILGEDNGIYANSQAEDEVTGYKKHGNVSKHSINVKSNNESVYVGYFGGDSNNNGNGIFNSGRNNISLEAKDLVVVQGGNTALNVKKETNTIVKGKDVVINSYGYGIKSEGVNNVTIGYTEADNKQTDSVIISGKIGVNTIADNLGKKDVTISADNTLFSDRDRLINGENNTINIRANDIEINADDCALNVSQEATAKGSDDNADIYTVWKNNVLNINANGSLNIVAKNDTAINADGINKINLKNTGVNFISGKVKGVNLSLSSNLVGDNTNEYYAENINNYASNKAKEYIEKLYAGSGIDIYKTCREMYTEQFTKLFVNDETGCSTLAEFYNKLFNDDEFGKQFEEQFGLDISTMDPKGDPAKELLVWMSNGQYTKEYVESLFEKQYGDVLLENMVKGSGCTTINEYFDKLVAEGQFEAINKNIDVKDEFNLVTEDKNIIFGGVNAFNIDGKLNAFVKGDVNYFKSFNYREKDSLDQEDMSSSAVSVDNRGSFRAEGNVNVLEAGKVDANGYGNEVAINVANGGKAVFVAENGGNKLSGSVFADGAGSVELISKVGNNTILSSTHGLKAQNDEHENDMHIVTAVFATGDSNVKIDAGNAGVNQIYSDVKFNESHPQDREITVWSEHGANVNIKGAVDIAARNSEKYVNEAEGNALGIAVSAGSRALEYDGAALKPVDNISKIDIDYTSDIKNSRIVGDIVAGYGGHVDIHSDNAKNNSLSVKGSVLSANNGVANIDFGNGGYWEGRADNYFGADKNDNADFFKPAFSNAIKESGKINVTMQNGMWNVTGKSWLTTFAGDNNIIDMVNYSADENTRNRTHAVSIQNMTGENNKFIMSLNNENRNDSDMLYIKDGNATINVEVTGTVKGLENVSRENGLRFATVGDGIKLDSIAHQVDGKAYVIGRDGGFYNTKLFVERQDYDHNSQFNKDFNGGEKLNTEKPGNEGVKELFGQNINDVADNLVIVKVEKEHTSDTGLTVLDLSKVNYSNAVYMDRFNKRMGEARFIDGDEGIWVRMRHDRIGKDNAFRSNNTMYEIGYDAKQLKEDGEHRVGFAMDYMDGSSSFSKVNGKGDVNRKGLWMYDSWLGENGHYRDFVAKWGCLSNDFEFMSWAGEAKGDFNNHVYSLSAEFGKKNDIGNNWYFEPQAQLQYAHVTGADYATTVAGADQTNVRNDAFNSLIARAGFRIGRDVNERSTVYFKGDLMHEFLGEQDVFGMDGTTGGKWSKVSYDNGGTWYDLGFGYSTKLNNASYAYIDFETSLGNDNEDTYQINAGVQWSF